MRPLPSVAAAKGGTQRARCAVVWILLLAALAGGAAGCARSIRTPRLDPESTQNVRDQQSLEAVELFLARRARVMSVTARLRVANATECADAQAPLLGFWGVRRKPGPYSPFLEALLNPLSADDRLTVVLVAPETPAARAGLAPGDTVLEVNGQNVGDPEDPLAAVLSDAEHAPVLLVERDGVQRSLQLERVPACAMEVLLSLSDGLETGPNRPHSFYVAQGYLDFVQSDDELAVVIAHEMAHQILDHPTGAYPENEVAAERLGLEWAARAGYDARVAPDLLRRIALEHPWAIDFEPPYPMAPEPAHGRIPERMEAAREVLGIDPPP